MKTRVLKKSYVVIACICAIVFCFSTINVLHLQYSKMQEEKIIDEVREKKKEKQSKKETTAERKILGEYQSLYEENNDLYGWIKIKGTTIDYPVMYTPENPNFYIDKNWKKEVCYKGVGTSIYISGEVKEKSKNIIIYGHNMKDSKMFGALKFYTDYEYYKTHKYIEFDTLYEKQRYEIISVSKAVVYYDESEIPENAYLFYNHIDLDSKEEFKSYIKYVKQNVWYNIKETAQYGDQLITLCTCNSWTKNGRLLVVAKKI